MNATITPTIGRKVWYRPFGHNRTLLGVWDDKQACDATVTYVWHDRMVNLRVTGPSGAVHQFNSTPLLQSGDLLPTNIEHGGYAEWVPYQLGQAKATPEVGTATYPDGTTVTGTLPLPADSPAAREGA